MTTTVEVTHMTLAAGTPFYMELDGTLTQHATYLKKDTAVEVVACTSSWNMYKLENDVLIYVKPQDEERAY